MNLIKSIHIYIKNHNAGESDGSVNISCIGFLSLKMDVTIS